MEAPAQFSGVDIEGADIAGGRRQRLGRAASHNQQVFVDDAGTGEDNRLLFGIAAESFAQIDAAILAEFRGGFAGARIEGVDKTLHGGEQARLPAIGPIDERAIGAASGDSGIELPEQFAGGGIERDHLVPRRQAEEDAVDHDGLGLRIAGAIGGIVAPGHAQPADVGAIDLPQGGIPDVRGTAAVRGPIVRRRARQRSQGCQKNAPA